MSLDEAAREYLAAKAELEARRESLAGAVRDSIACGMSESEAARRAGVTRMTVRAWLKD